MEADQEAGEEVRATGVKRGKKGSLSKHDDDGNENVI